MCRLHSLPESPSSPRDVAEPDGNDGTELPAEPPPQLVTPQRRKAAIPKAICFVCRALRPGIQRATRIAEVKPPPTANHAPERVTRELATGGITCALVVEIVNTVGPLPVTVTGENWQAARLAGR